MFKSLNQQVIRLIFCLHIFLPCICVYMFIRVCRCLCVCACVRTCLCVLYAFMCILCVCTSVIASTLFLETGTLTGAGAIDLARLGWPVCSSDSPVFSPYNHWAYRHLLFCLTFFWVLGGQTQVLILAGQHITAFTISAALSSSLGVIAATAIFCAVIYV